MYFFALYVHHRDWQILLSVGGLLLAAFGIFHFIRSHSSSAMQTFGFFPVSPKCSIFLFLGAVVGIVWGVVYRRFCGQAFFPESLRWFFPVACLIGATEEWLYRGVVQGVLRQKVSVIGAVLLAAFFHTVYKSALFTTWPLPVDVDLNFLALSTFIGGLVLGSLREFSGSVFPPIAAHALFDLIVYGDYVQAPWWVWS